MNLEWNKNSFLNTKAVNLNVTEYSYLSFNENHIELFLNLNIEKIKKYMINMYPKNFYLCLQVEYKCHNS